MPDGDTAEDNSDPYVQRHPLSENYLICLARARGEDKHCREILGIVMVNTVNLFGSRHSWHQNSEGVWTMTKRGLNGYRRKIRPDSSWTTVNVWPGSSPDSWWVVCPHCRHKRCIDRQVLGLPTTA